MIWILQNNINGFMKSVTSISDKNFESFQWTQWAGKFDILMSQSEAVSLYLKSSIVHENTSLKPC